MQAKIFIGLHNSGKIIMKYQNISDKNHKNDTQIVIPFRAQNSPFLPSLNVGNQLSLGLFLTSKC